MAGLDDDERQGCCRSHPLCCVAALILTAAVSVALAAGLGVTYRPIRNKVDDIIESVSAHVTRDYT